MEYVSLFSAGSSRWLAPALAALAVHEVPLQLVPAPVAGRLPAALEGLVPLGFAGALIEDEGYQTAAAGLVGRLEVEAREAGAVDAVRSRFGELEGNYLLPLAVKQAMEQSGFAGARVLWLGPPLRGLRDALRLASSVHVLRGSPLEGESFLEMLAPPQRGLALTDKSQAQALAGEVDLVVYNGGALPLALLQPYHGLFAFREPQQDAYMIVDQVISPGYFRQLYLSRLLGWVSGVDLPPEDFVE
ncbi:hypothetical protein [Oceanithermus sp.]